MEIEHFIQKYSPCYPAAVYARRFKTFEQAWEACDRGDWMLWTSAKIGVDDRLTTLAAGLCANTVRHLMQDWRSLAAVDGAIAYGRGEIDRQELLELGRNAFKAGHSDAASHATASTAATAAAAVDAVAVAIAAAAAAAAITVAAAVDHAVIEHFAATARKNNGMETANICREVLTESVFEKLTKQDKL